MSQVTTNKHTHKLLYAITIHPQLGNLIEAFAVETNQDQSFRLENVKVNSQNINDNLYKITEIDKEIIYLTDQYSEDNIVKKYSKKRERFSDFIKKIDENNLNNNLRPFIERNLNKIVQYLSDNSIDLYFKASKRDYIRERKFKLIADRTSVVFNFTRTKSELRYFLSIKNKEENINLFEKNFLILTNKPARLLIENKVYLFEDEFDSKKLLPFFSKEYISVPKRFEQKYFETFIKKSIKNYDVKAKGFDIEIYKPVAVPVLRLEKDWQGDAVLILEFKYGRKTFLFNSIEKVYLSLTYKNDKYIFKKIVRNPEYENKLKADLTALGLKQKEESLFVLNIYRPGKEKPELTQNVQDIISWINLNNRRLINLGIRVDQQLFGKKYYTGTIKFDLKITKKIDWFDVYAIVRFGEYKIPFIKLRKNILGGIKEYQLPDGSIAILPDEWFVDYKELSMFVREKDDKMILDNQFFNIIDGVSLGIDESYKKNFKKLTESTSLKSVKPPDELKAVLRPYQLVGYNWMYFIGKNNFGCCLADDMGLGKTVQTLALLLRLQNEVNSSKDNLNSKNADEIQLDLFSDHLITRKKNTSLIIMPTSLIHNWIKEIEKFTPNLKWYVHVGSSRQKTATGFKFRDVVLTTYGTVRNDLNYFKEFEFYYLILDESQMVKNPKSKTYKAVTQLNAKHRVILTGTPIENSLIDLWSQISFINPGLLGSLPFFKKEFLFPIEKQSSVTHQQRLKKLIQPFILRRNKKDVEKDLPDLTENIRYIEMTNEHEKIYERKKSEIRNLIFKSIGDIGLDRKMIAVLKGLMQLRLIANHPVLIDETYESESDKFNEIIRMLDDIIAEDHKVLIFSTFVKHLNIFSEYFKNNGLDFRMLTGSVRENKRKIIINDFQENDNIRLFLISIKAGGLGLNLTAADYVFILDPWWNPAVEAQAINRAHRIGQDKKVFAYKFITKGTVEEKILGLQQRKKLLADEFVNINNPLRSLTANEIENLFG